MAQTLRADKIVVTTDKLALRIAERFPEAGLTAVCAELVDAARATEERADRIARPNLWLRAATVAILISAGWAAVVLARGVVPMVGGGVVELAAAELTQMLEAGANLLILGGTAVYFLVSAEQRLKRHRVLAHLHELRSFAHVIDMHQLTKDPLAVIRGGERTKSSPTREMTAFQLARYLDYCTEMLAIVGKLAALYAERTRDAQVIAAVNDLEILTTGLGRKMWQKIMMIERDPLR